MPPESFQYDSREVNFKEKIKILTGLYKNGATIEKTQLYELGRAYIRKKLEDQLQEIEKSGQNTTSDYLVLKQVYEFFDYCNPLGRSIGDDMPGFEPDMKCNKALYKRWSGLYEQAFRDARDMYDYGDKLYGPQVYELARALFLVKLHSEKPTADDEEITAEQWVVMRSAFRVISLLNSPGGSNLTYAPDFKQKEENIKAKEVRWAKVEKILKNHCSALGIGDGLIAFLVGSPSSWSALSNKLPGDAPFEGPVIELAAKANNILTGAAVAFTDLENKQAADQNSLYANYVNSDDYAPFLPPSVRVHLLSTIGTSAEPSPDSLALNMKGFENHAGIYGMEGWQGIVKRYLQENARPGTPGKKEKPALKDFENYLREQFVLFHKVDLKNHSGVPLELYLKDASGEEKLGTFFCEASIFGLW